jgi:hypothetical protein
LLAGIAAAQRSAGYDLSWHVPAVGGGRSAAAHCAMNGTLGQPAVGFYSGARRGMRVGYWQAWWGHRLYLSLVASVSIGVYLQGRPSPASPEGVGACRPTDRSQTPHNCVLIAAPRCGKMVVQVGTG